MEYQTLKTKAVVLSEKDIGEADKLFTLYAENFGKIEVLGKSIRKIKAKLRGALQILNYTFLEFIQGKNFFIATDAILEENFKELKKDIKKYRLALYLCQLIDKLVKGQERDEKIWKLLLETLNDLQPTTYNRRLTTDDFKGKILNSHWVSLQLIVRYFEWNLLSLLGFEPELYHCVLCRERISQGKFYFSAKEGGVVCEKCSSGITKLPIENFHKTQEKNEAKEISRDAIKILRVIILQDKDLLGRLKISQERERELKELSKYYLSYILEEEIFVV